MKVRYAPRARNDIDEIAEYIQKDNPRAATAVVRQLRATGRLLGRHPELGRRTQHPSIRVKRAGRYPYLMYYRVDDEQVTIVHVRHGSRASPTPDDLR
jgi:addiction module RelE/StbE family toxin